MLPVIALASMLSAAAASPPPPYDESRGTTRVKDDDENPLVGTWTYFAARCGAEDALSIVREALRAARTPINGQLRIAPGRFLAAERDGDMCGLPVENDVGPTRRCEGTELRTTGRLRLTWGTLPVRGSTALIGTFSAESWVPPDQVGLHARQGFGTSRIEHAFEVIEVVDASRQPVMMSYRVLKISTLANEVFTDPCANAGRGPYTIYMVQEPSM